MKTYPAFCGIFTLDAVKRASALLLSLGALWTASAQAQTNGTWNAATGNYSATGSWVNGTIATGSGAIMTYNVTTAQTITFDQSVTLGSIIGGTRTNGQSTTFTSSNGSVLTFASGGTPVWNYANGTFSTTDYVTNLAISGTQGLTFLGGANVLVLQTGTTWSNFSGTVTLGTNNSDGTALFAQGNNVLSGTNLLMVSGNNGYGNSRLVLNGGTSQTIGALNNTNSGTQNAYIAAYNGTSSFYGITPSGTDVVGSSSTMATLTVGNGGGNGTFSGVIGGMTSGQGNSGVDTATANAAANASMNIIKTGTGTQIFSGANLYSGTTTVNAGTLLVTGTHTGAGAYLINSGGTLGGAGGSITTVNANVTLASGGKINVSNQGGTSGFVLTAGTMTLNLGTGSLDLSAAAGNNTGELTFSIGTVSDKIKIATGNLNIGVGKLDLADFTFAQGTGFGLGTYTLIDDSAGTITGSLAATGLTSTTLVNGDIATLSISGNDVLLTIAAVPEPQTWAMLTGGLLSFLLIARRRTQMT